MANVFAKNGRTSVHLSKNKKWPNLNFASVGRSPKKPCQKYGENQLLGPSIARLLVAFMPPLRVVQPFRTSLDYPWARQTPYLFLRLFSAAFWTTSTAAGPSAFIKPR